MPNTDGLERAIEIGKKNAAAVLGLRDQAHVRRAAALAAHPNPLAMGVVRADAVAAPTVVRKTAGFLVAMGDSWFDYPLWDVLSKLEDNYGFDIESSAHRGDPIEAMAYGLGQLHRLATCFEKVSQRGGTVRAVLVSGGGDDIAGEEFGMLLNSNAGGNPGWNDAVLDGVINERILNAYRTVVAGINALSVKYVGNVVPILLHGYDYPVPDGRGFLGGWGPLPGPWLKPGFDEKLFGNIWANVPMMKDIIDRFNTMLATLPVETANVKVVNLRGTLSNDQATYTNSWGNELHPTDSGFSAVAAKIAAAIP